jgi:hypothetical protein
MTHSLDAMKKRTLRTGSSVYYSIEDTVPVAQRVGADDGIFALGMDTCGGDRESFRGGGRVSY